MTRAERSDLLKVCRGRERVARAECEKRAARLGAGFEAQIAAKYSFDQDAVWNAATAEAEAVAREAAVRRR